MNCPHCNKPMKLLLTSFYCPNECDRGIAPSKAKHQFEHGDLVKVMRVTESDYPPDKGDAGYEVGQVWRIVDGGGVSEYMGSFGYDVFLNYLDADPDAIPWCYAMSSDLKLMDDE